MIFSFGKNTEVVGVISGCDGTEVGFGEWGRLPCIDIESGKNHT